MIRLLTPAIFANAVLVFAGVIHDFVLERGRRDHHRRRRLTHRPHTGLLFYAERTVVRAPLNPNPAPAERAVTAAPAPLA